MYKLFVKYEAWKAAFGLYDVMDACYHIHSAMAAEGGYGGPRIDEVFVDEVQDFTQAELRLFLALDPHRGFFGRFASIAAR